MDDRGQGFWNRVMDLLPSEAELAGIRRQAPLVFEEDMGEVRGCVDWEGAF